MPSTFARIVGQARHQHKADPDRLADRRQPLGEFNSRANVLTHGSAIGRRIPGLEVEQHEVDLAEIVVIGPRAEKTRRVQCGVKPHALGGCKKAFCEMHLHQWLSARDRQPATQGPQRRRIGGERRSARSKVTRCRP